MILLKEKLCWYQGWLLEIMMHKLRAIHCYILIILLIRLLIPSSDHSGVYLFLCDHKSSLPVSNQEGGMGHHPELRPEEKTSREAKENRGRSKRAGERPWQYQKAQYPHWHQRKTENLKEVGKNYHFLLDIIQYLQFKQKVNRVKLHITGSFFENIDIFLYIHTCSFSKYYPVHEFEYELRKCEIYYLISLPTEPQIKGETENLAFYFEPWIKRQVLPYDRIYTQSPYILSDLSMRGKGECVCVATISELINSSAATSQSH